MLKKLKLQPFKLLTMLLYGDYVFLKRCAVPVCHVELGPMARVLRVPTNRLKEYLVWLEQSGLIQRLVIDKKHAHLELLPPIPWK